MIEELFSLLRPDFEQSVNKEDIGQVLKSSVRHSLEPRTHAVGFGVQEPSEVLDVVREGAPAPESVADV